MDTKITIFFAMLIYWSGVITYLVSKKMQDRKIKKSSLYPEFLTKRTNSLLRSGKKIKNKELVPWYSEDLDARMNNLKEIKEMYKNTSVPEEKTAYKVVLQQHSKEIVKWCTKLKNEYRFILHRKDRKHLDAQINFANTILLES